jgi:hypothetical protein
MTARATLILRNRLQRLEGRVRLTIKSGRLGRDTSMLRAKYRLFGFARSTGAVAGLCLALFVARAAFAQTGQRGGQSFRGGSTAPGASFGAQGPAVAPPALTSGSRGYGSGYGRGTGRSGGYTRTPQRRYALPLSYYAAPDFYPSYYSDSSGYSDPNMASPPPDYGPDPNFDLAAELGELHREVADMRQMMMGPPPDSQAPGQPTAAPSPAPPPLVLIFRDGTTLEVRDFALIGQTLWDLSAHPTRKIALGQLNLEASIRATEARGAEFPSVQAR